MPLRYPIACLLLLACGRSEAKDYFLTVGGGYAPYGNQVSLEKNVQFFQRVLAKTRPDEPAHRILFADGKRPDRDLQYRAADDDTHAAVKIIAELFGESDASDIRYRDHAVAGVRAAATCDNLRKELGSLAARLRSGDRLVLYYTGHGGESYDEQRPHNTTLAMWNEQDLSQAEFTSLLDEFRPGVEVTLVMVQCHSGGFAHAIFNGGDPSLGLASRPRCGFFSQLHSRASAGCSADVDEADYQEYSSFFWAALAGEDRLGGPVEDADYDADGRVSLAEAHAYAMIASDTIDVPVRTSDALLWEYSKVGKGLAEEEPDPSDGSPSTVGSIFGGLFDGRGAAKEGPPTQPEQEDLPAVQPLRAMTGTLAELAELGRPDQRAVLERLPPLVGLSEETDIEQLRDELRLAKKRIRTEETKVGLALGLYTEAHQTLSSAVLRRWPELNDTYPAVLTDLLGSGADAFADEVRAMGAYRVFQKASKNVDRAADEALDAERREAKLRRLLRTCRAIVLAENLETVASKRVVSGYRRLLELEEAGLASQ
ncbi:Caspase domain protein [Pirellulimonas nuda]|uniref:Caspase domain protein n=1 Tax=Pirellulimonas nuda TaxID=2528009 RepID=A0A518D7T3_9BACT|nr:caspase family protein [Pirellulimonas nuda]QDU87538.1 Caspase domain protein [Pirellulimonas nuda]